MPSDPPKESNSSKESDSKGSQKSDTSSSAKIRLALLTSMLGNSVVAKTELRDDLPVLPISKSLLQSTGQLLGKGSFGSTYSVDVRSPLLEIDKETIQLIEEALEMSETDKLAIKVQHTHIAEDFTREIDTNNALREFVYDEKNSSHPLVNSTKKHVLFSAGMQLENGTVCMVSKAIPQAVSLETYYKDAMKDRSPEMMIKHMQQMKSAVDLFHTAGLLHNDISARNFIVDKNSNIILCDYDRALPCQNEKEIISNVNLAMNGPLQWMSRDALEGNFSRESDYHALKFSFLEMIALALNYGPGKANANALKAINGCQNNDEVVNYKSSMSDSQFFVECSQRLATKHENEKIYMPLIKELENHFLKKDYHESKDINIDLLPNLHTNNTSDKSEETNTQPSHKI